MKLLLKILSFIFSLHIVTMGEAKPSIELYGDYTYEYHLRDHLGSTRVAFTPTANGVGVLQENAYYPFGALIPELSYKAAAKFDDNRYYFTGHERINSFDLPWYDCGSRYYNPLTGIFMGVDPQAHRGYRFFPYAYCANNPIIYTDPDGEWFGIDDLIGFVIGGVVNLVVNIAQGNVHNLWDGLAAFGAGGVAGTLALYGPAGWAAGGAIVGATNAWLGGATGWDIVKGAGIGGISGLAGGAVGQWAAKSLGGLVINGLNITSPVLQGAVGGAIGGAAGGYVGGFTAGLITTGSVEQAHQAGISGLKMGGPLGLATGAISGYAVAKQNNIDPWTGDKITIKPPTYDFTPDPFGDNVILYRGITGNEKAPGPLFMTDNPEYAQQYILNGGKVEQFTIPKSTLKQMYYNGDLTFAIGQYYNSTITGTEYIFSPTTKYLFGIK